MVSADRLDRATQWIEWPVRRAVGSHRLNPLPHAGTISVFLFAVVVGSGLYLTLFFRYGYDASYDSVLALEQHPIQRVVRALHRYASAAMVVTTVVHAWRIFAAGRFTGSRRRWRWATGVAALVTVWLAGVTGYWLVWDIRAQALNDALIGLLGGVGADGPAATLATASAPGGSELLLVIWLAHLALTGVIGFFLYRHLRRSQLSWLPPRHWAALMGGALVLVSVAFPVGMLRAADPERLVGRLPLDPFVLFLLPPLSSGLRWPAVGVAAATVAVVVALPWLLARRNPPPVVVDEAACTGCELCVADCPYLALSMTDEVAVVDPAACVGCGICVGSCAFGALALEGTAPTEGAVVAGRPLAVVCDRHVAGDDLEPPLDAGAGDEAPVIWPVRCAGTFNPTSVAGFLADGATTVQVVGCPPADCRYGIGNSVASERIRGERRPRVPRRWSGLVVEDWVAPTQLGAALVDPGRHPAADGAHRPAGRNALIGAGLVVAASVIAIAAATRAPFTAADTGAVRLVLDHTPGAVVEGTDGAATEPGTPATVVVLADGDRVGAFVVSDGTERATGVIDVAVSSGADDIEVQLISGPTTVTIAGPETVPVGRRLLVEIRDQPAAPGASQGEEIFTSRMAGCQVCHSVDRGDDGVGPSLYGVATVAPDRVEGLDAAQYLRLSILLPDQYIVDGYPAGQMLPIYRDRLTDAEIDALVAYLLTLEADR